MVMKTESTTKKFPDVYDPSKCSSCGGRCCKRYSGNWSPEDLGSSREEILIAVREGLYEGILAIDCWDGSDSGYFARPSHTNARGKSLDRSWGGKCILLTAIGCSKESFRRPRGCREMDPAICGKEELMPEGYFGKYAASRAWKPYWKDIYQILRGTRISL